MKILILPFALLLLLLASPVFSQEDFYDWDSIPVVKIYFERDNWDNILSKMKEIGNKQRMSATMYIGGKKYEEVGIRFKGNSSYKSSKKRGEQKLPFNIKIDYKKKKQDLYGGYETLKLSNGFRDPTFLREVLSYEIARKYMPASKANFLKLYVNDAYLGIYNNTESVDSEFLKNHFGEKNGVFFKCDPTWGLTSPKTCLPGEKSSLMYLGDDPRCYFPNYEMKSDSGWSTLIHFTRVLNEHPERLHKYLDIDQTLWMHAFNNVLVNLDSYLGRLCHNYYLYQDSNGIIAPILWDMNLSFGGFRYVNTGLALNNEALATLSPLVHVKQQYKKRPLIVNLLNNNLWRKVYIAHIKTILKENFSGDDFKNRVMELADFIEEEIKEDPVRLYSFEDFKNNLTTTVHLNGTDIIGLTELMDARVSYLKQHPLLKHDGPAIDTVEQFVFGENLAVQATIDDAEQAWLFYQSPAIGGWSLLEMYDDSGHNDQLAGDRVWGATIPYEPGIRYLVIAENKNAATMAPERGSRYAYKSSGSEK